MNHTRLYYELTIVAFNYSDVNSFYKCDIDFKSEKRRLSLDEDGFIGKHLYQEKQKYKKKN